MADFKQRQRQLLALRARLSQSVEKLETAIREDIRVPGEISSVPTHPADADVEGIDNNLAAVENQEGLFDQVEAALERIEDGTYGSCADCGKPIGDARLDALPFTPYCIQCAAVHQATAAGD
jgi:RNA polymerase-binding protein DksA